MPKESPTIRRATALDAVAIVKLLLRGQKEYPKSTRVDHLKGIQHITEMMRTGLIVVAEKGSRIIGVIAMWYHPEDWNDEKFLDVNHFFVDPAHRRSDVASRLLKAVHAIQDQLGCRLHLSIVSNTRAAAKDAFMESSGYQYLGGNFMRNPDGQKSKENDTED